MCEDDGATWLAWKRVRTELSAVKLPGDPVATSRAAASSSTLAASIACAAYPANSVRVWGLG